MGGRLEATCDKAHPVVLRALGHLVEHSMQGVKPGPLGVSDPGWGSSDTGSSSGREMRHLPTGVLSKLGSVASGLIIEARGLGVCNLGSGLALRASSRP